MTTNTEIIYTKHDVEYAREYADDLARELESANNEIRALREQVRTLLSQREAHARQIDDALGDALCVRSYLDRVAREDAADVPRVIGWANGALDNVVLCLSRR